MKKYLIFILGISFMLVLTLTSNYSNIIGTSYNKEGSISRDITIDKDKLTVLYEEEKNELIYTDTFNVIDSLALESDVSVTNIQTMENTFTAFGTKNNNPYMQEFKIENQKITSTTEPLVYIDATGSFIDRMKYDYFTSAKFIDVNRNQITQDFIEGNNQLIPFYKKHIQHNHFEGTSINLEYIVIHETANTAAGADANAHYRYWNNNPSANASTHFVVDNNEIYQMLDLHESAWHVGDNHGHSDITNLNSIGIEVAVNEDGNFNEARQNAIDLTIQLMRSLDMDITQLKRHYDASGKYCPTNMLQTPELWEDFVAQVQTGLEQ